MSGEAFIFGNSCNKSFCLDFSDNTKFFNENGGGKSEIGFVVGTGQISQDNSAPSSMEFFLTKQNGGAQSTVVCSDLPLGEVSYGGCSWTGNLTHPGGPFQPALSIEMWAAWNTDDTDTIYFTGEIRGSGWDEANFLRMLVAWDTVTSTGSFSIQPRNLFPEDLPTWMLTLPPSWICSFSESSCDCNQYDLGIAYSGSMGGYQREWPAGTHGCLWGCAFLLDRFIVYTFASGSWIYTNKTDVFDPVTQEYTSTPLPWFSNPWEEVTLSYQDQSTWIPQPNPLCYQAGSGSTTLIAEW